MIAQASIRSNQGLPLLVIAVLIWCVDANAQTVDLRFRSAQELVPTHQKSVFSALAPLDPMLKLSFDDTTMKLRIAEGVSIASLIEALEATGAGPFQRIGGTVAIKEALDDRPAYIDTGNPQHDEADLATRKQAWAEAHPEAHAIYLQQVQDALELGLPLPE